MSRVTRVTMPALLSETTIPLELRMGRSTEQLLVRVTAYARTATEVSRALPDLRVLVAMAPATRCGAVGLCCCAGAHPARAANWKVLVIKRSHRDGHPPGVETWPGLAVHQRHEGAGAVGEIVERVPGQIYAPRMRRREPTSSQSCSTPGHDQPWAPNEAAGPVRNRPAPSRAQPLRNCTHAERAVQPGLLGRFRARPAHW
jgi:hypothetical protein